MPLGDSGLPKCPFAVLRSPIGNPHEANSWYRCPKLKGDGAAGGTGSDHSDADRTTRGFKLSKGCIYNHGMLQWLGKPANEIISTYNRNIQGPLHADLG